jgi:IclR family transcriptional regulator, acetate operon repressor
MKRKETNAVVEAQAPAMSGVLERTLGILEHLSAHSQGRPLAAIADELGLPRSAAHRLLSDLCRCGYVRQLRAQGDYVLTTKLVALGLHFLSDSGVIDIAQPLLDRLAETSGEFVRLGVIDNQQLTWVAKAQGARRGLRYDPEMGMEARLSCTASGHAWLLTLPEDKAIELVARQGIGSRDEFGPNAPRSVRELLTMLSAARKRGFSLTQETFVAGMTAMAAPVRRPGQPAVGVISIAGPAARFTEARMLALAPTLLAAADELAAVSGASLLFGRAASADRGHPVTAL